MQIRTSTAIFCAALALAGVVDAQQTILVPGDGAAPGGQGQVGIGAQAGQDGDQRMADICATGLALTDVGAGGAINRQQFDRFHADAFGAIDKDGDGRISRAEYVDCLNAGQGQPIMAADRTAENMGGLDTDQSGTISPDEFMIAVANAHRSAMTGDQVAFEDLKRLVMLPEGVSNTDIGQMNEARIAAHSANLFRMLDADRSGEISQAEWTATASMQGDLSPWFNAEFAAMDAAGTGMLTPEQFQAYAGNRWEAGEAAATARQGQITPLAGGAGAGGAGQTGGEDIPQVFYHYFGPLTQGG